MSKSITVDVGMREHERLQYDPLDEKDSTELVTAWLAAVPEEQPGDLPGDAQRRENANRCNAILAASGVAGLMDGCAGAVSLRPLREAGLNEDSAAWIAAHWLGAYHRLIAIRRGQPDASGMALMLTLAEDMGRLQERMWWRCGIDACTGARREQLALGKRRQQKAIPKASEARRIQAQDAKPDWHDDATLDAIQIRRRHPSFSRWRIAGEIHEKYKVSRNRCDKVLRANGID